MGRVSRYRLGFDPWGLGLFLLGMKYGDKMEEMLLRRLKGRKTGETE